MLWISSTSTRSTDVRAAVAQTALVTSVRLARAGSGQPEEPGELDREHPRGRGRRDGDVDDRQPVPVAGVPLAGGQLVGAAELGERGGLAGARRAADDHAAAGGDLVPVELDQQPAGADDLPDDRGVHQRQAGVVVDPRLVVPGPLRRVQARQGCGVQEDRRGRLGVHEPPPPLLGGQRVVSGGLARRPVPRRLARAARRSRRPPVGLGAGVEDAQRDHLRHLPVLARLLPPDSLEVLPVQGAGARPRRPWCAPRRGHWPCPPAARPGRG